MANSKPPALITGASSGIGSVFARKLAQQGYGIILVARRRDRMETLANEIGGAEIIAADLTRDYDLQNLEKRIAGIKNLELLVNNAGFGTRGRFWEADFAAQEKMHKLHIMATMRLSHAALRIMVPRGQGGLINVSSVAAFGRTPGSVSYCSTKTWINAFTEGLSLELRSIGSPVKVQALCPGFTYSEFHDAAQIDRNTIPARLWLKAEDVVDASLQGLAKGKVIVVPGAIYKALVKAEEWAPRWLQNAAALRYGKRAKRDELQKSPAGGTNQT